MTDHNRAESFHSKTLLNIASLIFEITSLKSSIIHEYDPAYKQFLIPKVGPGEKTIPVQLLQQENMPDLASMTKIFDTSQSWSMYEELHDKFIAFHPLNKNEPAWVARINGDLQNVSVFCRTNNNLTDTSRQKHINPVRYPLDQLLLINFLIGKGLLIHAAGVVINGKGYIFAGHSGAGKSTICQLIAGNKALRPLSDDRIVIRKNGQEFSMYGTPWPGDAGIAVNDCARLHGIFFLRHTEDNNIKELRSIEALKYLFKVASLPLYNEDDLQQSLDLCDDLLKEVKTYELHFRPGPEIVEDIMSFVSG